MDFEAWLISKGIDYLIIDNELFVADEDLLPYRNELRILFDLEIINPTDN